MASLEAVVARIADGERPDARDFLDLLTAAAPAQRAAVHLALARALLAAGDPARARPYAERAFLLAGRQPEVLDVLAAARKAAGDVPGLRAARKLQGLVAAEAGDVARALEAFNAWHYTDAECNGVDRYELDPDVLAAVRRLAAPHRRPVTPPAPLEGRPLRVAHLAFGATHYNSVIMRISRLLAAHRDRSRFAAAFFVPESRAQVASSKQGGGHVAFLEHQGCEVFVSEVEDPVERMRAVAAAIADWRPDLLVVNAALADFFHYYLLQLRPAPATVGFVSGPPAQFAPPDLDWGIAWTLHPLMDAPIPCSHVPLETFEPPPAGLRLRPRAALGIPEDSILIALAGRKEKFRCRQHWARLLAFLHRRPAAHLLCVGVSAEQLPEIAADLVPYAGRIHFHPWAERYLEVFGQADIVLDTFPSGGGLVLTDAMALGKPVLTFQNDYGRPYDQAEWLPAEELMPACDLVVPRDQDERWLSVLCKLSDDPVYREAMGEACRATVQARLGDPARMVRRCEEVFARVIEGVRATR